MKTTIRVAALSLIVMSVAAVASLRASETGHTQYLTFSKPVALPGVTLGSGTYIFEMPSPEASQDVVRVMSRDRKIVYLTAFTRPVAKPASLSPTALVSMREVAAGQPAPIAVWWSDLRSGRQFVYVQ